MATTSASSPFADSLQQARLLLAQGDLSAAKERWQHLLQQSALRPNQSITGPVIAARLSALAGLIELAARKRQSRALEDLILVLKAELERLPSSPSSITLTDSETAAVAEELNSLCESLGGLRNWRAVKRISRLIIRLLTPSATPCPAHRIRALNNLGSALLAESRYDDAILIWQTTLDQHADNPGPSTLSPRATIHNNLAELRRLQCRIPEACQQHQLALQLRLRCFPNSHVLVRQSRINYTQVLIESWRYQAALEQIEAYLHDPVPDDSPQQLENERARLFQARLLIELGRLQSAETLINQLVRTLSKLPGSVGRLQVECHLLRLELAMLFDKAPIIRSQIDRLPGLLQEFGLVDSLLEGRYQLLLGRIPPGILNEPIDSREAHLQHALRIFRQRLPRNHPWIAITIFQLAQIYVQTQRGQRAVQTANSALSVIEQTFGDQSLPMLHAYIELGDIVQQRQQFKTVRELMKLALQLRRNNSPVPPPTEYRLCQLLSAAYQGLKRLKPAAYFARRACQILQSQMEAPPAQQLAAVEQALTLSLSAGHQPQALEITLRKINLLTQEHHAQHPLVNAATEALGRLYAEQGQAEPAAAYLSQILIVRCTELGEESLAASELRDLTARMHRQNGDIEKAELLEEQQQLLDQKSSHVLSDLF